MLTIERRRKETGCFTMLTNLPADGGGSHTGKEVLVTYKEQNGIEKDFGFLKDDAIVNALFPKKENRIDPLGFVILVSLLI